MKKLFCILSAISFCVMAYAQKQDAVSVAKVEFKQVPQGQIILSAGEWTRVAIEIMGNENPDKKANNNRFIRDVDVTLTLVYRDEKAKNKKSADSLMVFKNKARLFAIEVGKKTAVVFYMPFEAKEVYDIKKEPFAWSIDLSVGGTAIELSKKNYKTLLSKVLCRGSDIKKIYENYQKFVQSGASANENVLMNLSQAPYNVQEYEYKANPSQCKYIPTYITTK